MKTLEQYMVEALQPSGTTQEQFCRLIGIMNAGKGDGSFYHQIEDIAKDAKINIRGRRIGCSRSSWGWFNKERSYVSSLDLGPNPIRIWIEHTKKDQRNREDRRRYGELKVLFDPAQAQEAMENNKPVNFVFVRGVINPEIMKTWKDAVGDKEAWAAANAGAKGLNFQIDWDVMYGNLTWSSEDYEDLNKLIEACTGINPNISETTPDKYRFEAVIN